MRRDGKKIKVENVEYALTPHIMPDRCDSMNFTEVDIPLKPMQDFLNAKRKEGKRISHLALVLAAYTRVIGEFPQMNRFVINKKVYARKELAESRKEGSSLGYNRAAAAEDTDHGSAAFKRQLVEISDFFSRA